MSSCKTRYVLLRARAAASAQVLRAMPRVWMHVSGADVDAGAALTRAVRRDLRIRLRPARSLKNL